MSTLTQSLLVGRARRRRAAVVGRHGVRLDWAGNPGSAPARGSSLRPSRVPRARARPGGCAPRPLATLLGDASGAAVESSACASMNVHLRRARPRKNRNRGPRASRNARERGIGSATRVSIGGVRMQSLLVTLTLLCGASCHTLARPLSPAHGATLRMGRARACVGSALRRRASGSSVLFQERGLACDSIYVLRNPWQQDLGLIDGLGPRLPLRCRTWKAAWVGSGRSSKARSESSARRRSARFVELDSDLGPVTEPRRRNGPSPDERRVRTLCTSSSARARTADCLNPLGAPLEIPPAPTGLHDQRLIP